MKILKFITTLLCFVLSLSSVSADRVTADLQALYDFEEGTGTTITDISGVAGTGNPLNLGVENASYAWGGSSPNGYFDITAENRASNTTDSNKIFDAVTANDEITVEAWITPTEVNTGPGRIVTLSEDSGNRNFTVGQDGTDFQIRLRTTTNGVNGNTTTLDGGAATVGALVHVVFTRDDLGNAVLYVTPSTDTNIGQVDTETIGGDFGNWDAAHDLGIGNEFTSANNDAVRNFNGEYHLVAVYSRALSSVEVQQNFDEGPVAVIPPAEIGGVVLDSNGGGLSGVTVTAFDGATQADQTTTAGDGSYTLTGLTDTTAYDVVFVPPAGYLPTQSQTTATSPELGVNATFTAHAEVGCSNETPYFLDWGAIPWVDPPNSSSYPWVQTFTDVSGSGVDVTVTIPREHRSGNTDYIDTVGEDLDVYAGDSDVLRFWHPDDNLIDEILVSFSKPVAARNMVFGGNRLNSGAYGALEFRAFDGPNGTGNVVLPNSSVHPDPNTIDSIVRGVAVADPAGGAFTITDHAGTGGVDLKAAYIPARESYVHVGQTGSRNWGIVDYQEVPIRSLSWEEYISTVDDPATARDNLGAGQNNSAYLGSFDFVPIEDTCDFGDLPDTGAGAYETLAANDGARHVVDGVTFLGTAVDIEADGLPATAANGDDTDGSPDDEDGVTIPTLLIGNSAVVTVVAGSPGALSAFVDFDGDGTLDPVTLLSSTGPAAVATGVIGDTLLTAAGTYQLTIQVSGTAVEGGSYARFRFTENQYEGGNSTSGPALTGEVEDYPVTIACPTITVSPGSLPNGTIGVGYEEFVSATGSQGPFEFSAGSGSLPAGLDLDDETGQISGIPTGPATTSNFTIVATDVFGCAGSAAYTIGISCNTLDVLPASLPDGQVGAAYSATFTSSNASGTVDWALTSGALPNGLTLTSAGVLSGTPTEGGSFSVGVTGTDDNSCSGSANLGLDIPTATIAGRTDEDTDGDGDADVAINITTIRLFAADGATAIDNPNDPGNNYVITTTDGTYAFTNLAPGDYVVKQDQPNGYLTVTDGDTTTPGDDSPANSNTTDNQIPVTVVDGETDNGNDFVEVVPLSIGNLVFCDDDNDGLYEPGATVPEVGINGVTVQLLFDSDDDGDFTDGDATPVATQLTANDGSNDGAYRFDNLLPGNYRVVIPTSNFAASAALEDKPLSSSGVAGGDDGADNDDNGIQIAFPGFFGPVESSTIVLAPGVEPFNTGTGDYDSTIDFGFIEPVGIGNLVYIDLDDNGIYESSGSDIVIQYVTVELYDAAAGPGVGGAIATTETDANGCYSFTGLLPGSFIVHIPAAEFSIADDGDGQGTTGELSTCTSITGHGGDDHIDDDLLGNDAGIDSPDPSSTGISSVPINLAVGAEPVETGKDAAGDTPDDHFDYTVDFGFTDTPNVVGVGNLVFLDSNGDGDFDSGSESGIDGVVVELFTAAAPPGVGSAIAETVTHDGGCYFFSGLAPGSYVVHIRGGEFGGGEPLNSLVSSAGADSDGGVDDDANENGIDNANPTAGGVSSLPINLASGAETPTNETGKDSASDDTTDTDNDLTVDFGFTAPNVGLGNLVFGDTDGNGIFNGGETGIDGVTVELYTAGQTPGSDTPVASTTTVGGGCYAFTGLAAGDYVVHVPAANFATVLSGLVSSPGATGDNAEDDNVSENGLDTPNPSASGTSSAVIALLAGAEPNDGASETGKDTAADTGDDLDNDLTVDFGFTAPGNGGIGNKVFADTNRNGILDPSESGIDGVLVELYADGGVSPLQSTVTTGGGCYYFSNLPDGDYFVHIPVQNFANGAALDGTVSSPGNGGDDGADDDANENGIDSGNPADFGISSGIVALAAGTEGTESGAGGGDDNGAEADNDLSVDMGFVTATGTVGVGNLVFRDGNQDGNFDPATESGIDGVTVELYPFYGPTGGLPIATTTTANGGCYLFTGLAAGNPYFVHIPASEFAVGEPLYGFKSSVGNGAFGADIDDDGDEDGIDTATPTVDGVTAMDVMLESGSVEPIGAGESGKDGAGDDGYDADINMTVDLGFTGKADSFATWQNDNIVTLGAENAPDDNPDGDLYDNALEYALCDHPGSGANQWPFCVGVGQLSGTVDATFYRADPAPADVTYTLEIAPSIGSPPAWTASTTTPAVTSLVDGFALVTYPDLESELASGIARLKVEITGDTTGPHYTPVFGWSTVSAQAECETVSNPYAPKEVFAGTVDDGSTAVLDLSTSAGSADISAEMANRPHYIEIVSGACAGHRFDVLSATADSLTLDTTSARNTLSPIPDLTGEQIALRPHTVLDDVTNAQDFVDTVTPANNDDPATAGRLLFFDNVNGWSTYFAYNNSGALSPAIWTSADNSGLENVGNAVLSGDPDDMLVIVEPCAGFFVHSKAQAVDLLMVGIVREWDFACPLTAGYNFVGSAYPEDQSPNDRDMDEKYFLGTTDPSTADQIEFWISDGATSGVDAYDSHFRVDCGDYMHWTTQENSSLATEDAMEMFKIQRAAFINSRNGNAKTKAGGWTWPVPWDADAPET